MSRGVLCRSHDCRNYAAYKYRWPGRAESAVCAEHLARLAQVARSVGLAVVGGHAPPLLALMALQVSQITPEEHMNSRLHSDSELAP